MRKEVRSIIKICVFLTIANLPFITVTQLVGFETFLDTFENPEYYRYIKDSSYLVNFNIDETNSVILQKSTHPNYKTYEGDIILYCKNTGEIACNKVFQINSLGPIKRYRAVDNKDELIDDPIYENQIIGKIVSEIDNNLWNVISMKIWDVSIHEYNINALFSCD